MLALCKKLRDEYSIAAVTNDIFTRYACVDRLPSITYRRCDLANVHADLALLQARMPSS